MGTFAESLQPILARPTLRGLVVRSAPACAPTLAGEIFPWQNLERIQDNDRHCWRVIDLRGRPVKREAQRLSLVVQGWRAGRAARRAQVWAFRQDMENGSLLFRFRSRHSRRGAWTGLVLGAVLLVLFLGGMTPFAIKALNAPLTEMEVPDGDVFAFLIRFAVFGTMLAGSVVLVPIIWVSVRLLRQHCVSRAKLTSAEVRVVLSDGVRFVRPWASVVQMDRRRITFDDGMVLWFAHATTRLNAVLHAVRDIRFGRTTDSECKALLGLLFRLAVAGLIGWLIGAVVLARAAPILPRPETWFRMWLLVAATAVPAGLFLFATPLIDWIADRWRRPRERAAARQARLDRLSATIATPATAQESRGE